MFYVCSKDGNKYGVMDTADNVMEFYSREELSLIQNKYKIKIVQFKEVQKILDYVSNFCLTYSDLGSDYFYDVLNYVQTGKHHGVGGSLGDYADSLIRDWKSLDKSWGIPFNIYDECRDALIVDLINLYNYKYSDRVRDLPFSDMKKCIANAVSNFASKWKLESLNYTMYK